MPKKRIARRYARDGGKAESDQRRRGIVERLRREREQLVDLCTLVLGDGRGDVEDPDLALVYDDIAEKTQAGCLRCKGPLGIGPNSDRGFCSHECSEAARIERNARELRTKRLRRRRHP